RVTARNDPIAGTVTIDLFTPLGQTVMPLPAGPYTFATLMATVPTTAGYGKAEVLQVADLQINEGQIASTADDGVHVAGYLGDATGDQTYSGMDAGLIARVVVGLDSGFSFYPTVDPRI